MATLQKPTVLVLGASGQIGNFVVRQLDQTPEEVHVRVAPTRPKVTARRPNTTRKRRRADTFIRGSKGRKHKLVRKNQEESRAKLATIERKAASDSRRTLGDPGTHYPDLNPARIPYIHGMIFIGVDLTLRQHIAPGLYVFRAIGNLRNLCAGA
jgi:uncharacterized protein YbjT (DUF2867 family)